MSWESPLPFYRSPGGTHDIRLSYERRTKFKHSRSHPPIENREKVCGKQYLDGLEEYIHKCDLNRWSKLEVDDVLEKLGLDVTKVDYFILKSGMTMDDWMKGWGGYPTTTHQ